MSSYKNFEFNTGPKAKTIKLIPDQKTISDANRYPELLVEGFLLFKSLTDKYPISVEQKKANRERLRRKLAEKQYQVQATARFETENQESEKVQ